MSFYDITIRNCNEKEFKRSWGHKMSEQKIEKLDLKSSDIVEKNIEKIGNLFPNVIVESEIGKAIDFDMLKQELSRDIVEGPKEKYQLTWPGKKESMLRAFTPTTKTLRPVREKSVDFDNTQNIYIEGDNLETLKILQESYLNKIKCIYIDPPYNTGKDFVYRDDYKTDTNSELSSSGQIDEYNNKLITNLETDGKFHSVWLSMMYPRLELARNLLSDDGVIFISIDDNEYHNLKKICDEIFQEQNLLETFHIQVRYGNKSLNEKDNFQKLIEYTLVYAKNKQSFIPNKPVEEYDVSKFCFDIKELKKADKHEVINGREVDIFLPGSYSIEKVAKEDTKKYDYFKETWVTGSIYSGTGHGKVYQQVVESRTEVDGYGVLYKIYGLGEDGLGYRYMTGPKQESANKGKMYNKIPLDKLEQLKNGGYEKTKPIINFFDYSADFGNIRHEGGIGFNSGKKPIKMLKQYLQMIPGKDFIVLDFFAGSSSTAHAVMQLNAEDEGRRKYIMVQIPENCEDNVDMNREGFKTICDLGEERIRKSADKIKQGKKTDIDLGFRVYQVDSSNMKDIYYRPAELEQTQLTLFESNMKEDRTPEDLLTQVILNLGLTLDLKVEEKKILDNNVYFVDGNSLIACFDSNIDLALLEEISKEKPLRLVFQEKSFQNDNDMINMYEKLKKILPETQITVL